MPDTLNVNLGERSYPILFAEDLTEEVRALVSELTRLQEVRGHNGQERREYQPDTQAALWRRPTLTVPSARSPSRSPNSAAPWTSSQPGARQVRLRVCGGRRRRGGPCRICGGLLPARCRLLPVPTTLLAMVDSSVGGKTGINLKAARTWRALPPAAPRLHATGFLKLLPRASLPRHGRGHQDGPPGRQAALRGP